MSELMEIDLIVDKHDVTTLSAPEILLRAGLKVETVRPQEFSAAQFENLAREIDEELSSLRVSYERRLYSVTEEKADIARRYSLLLERNRWEQGGTLDAQAEHARSCAIASAGESGITLLLSLSDGGGSMDRDSTLTHIGSSFSFLQVLVQLGAAGVLCVTKDGIKLTDAGWRIAQRLTELAE
jgi:hypothetical protein